MRSILEWSMQLRLLILAIAGALIVFGFTQLRNISVDVLPEFSRPYVEIQTEALGLSASEVESMITVPLEADMLNGVPWVDEIRSESIPGLSSIILFFEAGTEMLTARQLVQERLIAVHALPNVSKPPAMLQPVSSSNRFMAVGLTSETLSLIEMSVLSRWTIVPRLMGVPGVAQVSIWGQRKRQLQVLVDPQRLREQGVTLQQIVNTTGNALWMSPLSYLDASTPGTGGWIETPAQRIGIQHLLPISTPEDLAKVTVEGTTLSLGSLTRVVENHQPLIGDALIDEAPGLMLVIEKFPWASTIEVTEAVDEAITALELGLPGVKMDTTMFRPATYLGLVIENLSTALVLGSVFLVIGLLILLYNWRTALIALVAVAVSSLAAIAVLYIRDVTINMMVLCGLMAGLLVLIDDAVIDIQNIARRLQDTPHKGDMNLSANTIFSAVIEMRHPIIYATVIIALGLAPLLLLEGVAGAFISPIILSYGLALLVSMVATLTLIPALCIILLKGSSSTVRQSSLLASIQNGVSHALGRVTRLNSNTIALPVLIIGAIVITGFWFLPKSGESILPSFQERDVLINVDGMPGTSEHAMRRIVARISAELRPVPGVRTVSAHVGRAVMSDTTEDINGGEVWVSLDPESDNVAALAAIREIVGQYPGMDIDVDTFLSERLKDEIGNNGDDLVVRVYGEDMQVLSTKAEELVNVLSGIEGVIAPEVQYQQQHPNLEIELNLAAAMQYGLKPGDVRRAAATLLSGIEVGSLFEAQKVFDVVVWGTPELRHSLTGVGELLLDTPSGGHVRLKEVADTRIVPQPTVIMREGIARHLDVIAEIKGRDLAAVTSEATSRIRNGVEFPLEYRAEVLGEHLIEADKHARVIAIVIAALIGIYLLLQVSFGSWSLAFVVFFALPISVIGGVITALIFGHLSALGSLLGFVAVLVIALRNALTLIAHFRYLQNSNSTLTMDEVVQKGVQDRLLPIVTTATAIVLALLPFLLFGNIAGLEILHPMAIVVTGGVVSAAFVNLFIIPALYLRFAGDIDDPLNDSNEEFV